MRIKATVRKHQSGFGLFGRIVSSKLAPYVGKEIEIDVLEDDVLEEYKKESEKKKLAEYYEFDEAGEKEFEKQIENFYIENIEMFQANEDEKLIDLAEESCYWKRLDEQTMCPSCPIGT